MSRVHGRDTRPELAVRRLVTSLGYRYRLHVRELPGSPDLVFRRLQKVIFVHGCFWHGHQGCCKGRLPKSRVLYWRGKIEANKKRDKRAIRMLRKQGWEATVVWQCEIPIATKLLRKLQQFLEK